MFVDADTIDSLMKNHLISEIDILKIDIEGAEKYIFDDSTSYFRTLILFYVHTFL